MATSYGTTIEADAYFAARGVTSWDAQPEEAKAGALMRASAYIDRRFGGRWKGTRATATQSLAWPRVGVVDGDGYQISHDVVPEVVKEAAMEAALALLQGASLEASPLDPAPLSRKRVKAEGVETEKEFAVATTTAARSFLAVDAGLAGLLKPARSSSQFLARA